VTKIKISLAKPWTFHSIARTIDFPAGEHDVDAEIANKAKAEGALAPEKKDTANANGPATAAATSAGRPPAG
jgi:hypothetical protein